MKIQKTELAQKLNKIKGVVPKKTNMIVLQGVLVKDGYLIANNMEMAIKAKIEGTTGESFIIPERAFDLISNLPDGEIEILPTAGNTITIKADKIKNKYKTMDSDMFPTIDKEYKDESELTIKSELLLESMKKVLFAVPAQSANMIMTTVCLQAFGGQLNITGLDGHVVAWDKIDYDGEFELLIPKSTIEKLKSIGISGEMQIRHNKSSAIFITEEFEVYTRLVNGEYFKYQHFFNELPLHTIVSRTELLDAMNRAKMCTEEKCPVHFNLEENLLNLSIKDNTTDYHETVELKEKFIKPLEIGFNARLVLESLKAFDCEDVCISLDSSKMPMILQSGKGNFKTMVLPVAIR